MERHRYIIRLSTEERHELDAIVKKGKSDAHKIRNAQIVFHSDENGERLTVEAIARLLHCNKDTVCEARTSHHDRLGAPNKAAAGRTPDAKKVTLVCDHLNTHKPPTLYKTF